MSSESDGSEDIMIKRTKCINRLAVKFLDGEVNCREPKTPTSCELPKLANIAIDATLGWDAQ